jgi:fucose permease
MATKTSILLFYLSISKGNKIFRWATITTLAIVNIAGIALTFLNAFQCRPVDASFETPVPDTAHCADILTLYLSSAPVNIITDMAILFLPMPILTAMRLPRKQKTILVITFGFGFFVAIVDVIRIVYLQSAIIQRFQDLTNNTVASTNHDQRNDTDLSWYASFSYMWSAIEVNVGIMCANVPGLKPLVSRFMPYILGDRTERTRGATSEHDKIGSSGTLDRNGQPHALHPPISARLEPSANSSGAAASEDHIGMMDFLTTPDMAELPQHMRDPTMSGATRTTRATRKRSPERATFFDFVNIKKTKSMVKLTNRESLFPNLMVTILFFLWGVAYGFLDSLNSKFQLVANITPWQTIGIHSAYFGAYGFGSLVLGRIILKKIGFKACFMAGLCIYACGILVFWPSAVLTSFPAFLVSNFIVGMGLSVLEVAANPFVALCGPSRWMELRLNLSQAIPAIGTVVSPLLADKVLFKSTGTKALVDVQWTYLGIALFTVLLAVAYYYVPLPEATDEELEQSSEHPDFIHLAEIRGRRLVIITLAIGVFAQFCYVGAQECLSTTFTLLTQNSLGLNYDSDESLAIGHSLFAAGRFLAVILNIFIKPRHLLLLFCLGTLISSALAMRLYPHGAYSATLALYFFEGPIFSFIYAITLRGLGRATKDGSALLTAAIAGGAIFPPILFGIARDNDTRLQPAYAVIVAAWAAALLYPIYLNSVPLARRMADPVKQIPHLPHVRNEDDDTARRPSNLSGTTVVKENSVSTVRVPELPPFAVPNASTSE